MRIEGLCETDNLILDAIRDNARLSYSEIAERVGVSRVAVKNRMDRMETEGIICGYRTQISLANVPDQIQFLIDIETYPEFFEDVADLLAKSKGIRRIYNMSGSCEIHAEGFSSSARNLQLFVNSLYHNAKQGIKRISCKTVLSILMDADGGISYEGNTGTEHLEAGGTEGQCV